MIKYKHENGYSALLYGNSSMGVFKDGKEVLHTGFRNVNTKEEVMELLEDMPQIMEELNKRVKEEGAE